MNNETDLDWLARNVHVWPEGKREALVCWPRNVDTLIWSCVSSNAGWVTKEQWLARRAELQNKPSWDKADGWADWLAQDSYGCWGFFQKKPQIHALSWIARSGYYQIRSPGNLLLGDWRDTLEKSPADLSEQVVTARLKDATDNVLAAVPELMTDKYKFTPFISIKDNQEKDMKQDNGWFERGELPPVGSSVTVVEVDGLGLSDLGREFVGEECKVMAVFTRPELSHSDAVDVVVVMEHGGGCCCFVLEMIRPIRTERDELIDVIKQWDGLVQTDEALADAILAAGFSRRDK